MHPHKAGRPRRGDGVRLASRTSTRRVWRAPAAETSVSLTDLLSDRRAEKAGECRGAPALSRRSGEDGAGRSREAEAAAGPAARPEGAAPRGWRQRGRAAVWAQGAGDAATAAAPSSPPPGSPRSQALYRHGAGKPGDAPFGANSRHRAIRAIIMVTTVPTATTAPNRTEAKRHGHRVDDRRQGALWRGRGEREPPAAARTSARRSAERHRRRPHLPRQARAYGGSRPAGCLGPGGRARR